MPDTDDSRDIGCAERLVSLGDDAYVLALRFALTQVRNQGYAAKTAANDLRPFYRANGNYRYQEESHEN
jgi:hypothetical protein